MALKKECPRCRYRNSVSVRKCVKCGQALGEGIVYWIDVWLGGRRLRERIGPSYSAAKMRELALKKQQAEKKALGQEMAYELTLGEFWPRYAAWCRLRNKDLRNKKSRWKNHLSMNFSKISLAAVDRKAVENYRLKRLNEGARPATINRETELLRHMLSVAVQMGLLERNPLQGLGKLPEQNDDKWKYLTKKEFSRLEQAISPNYKDLLIFLTYTGLRLGDVLNLTWQDVNMETGVVYIRANKTKGGRAFGIPLHPRALEVLKRRKHNTQEKIFPHSDSHFRRAFKKALNAAGLPNIRIHDLRHTFASWLALEGVPIQQIKELLGHSTIQMTLRYAHLNPSVLREAVLRI